MNNNKKIVIIGGVAGGASAATRARRLSENAEITVFERGEYISFANCGLPYHIGGVIKERDQLLVQTPQGMKNRFNIDVRIKTEVIKIDRNKKEVLAKNLDDNSEYSVPYDNLILSPGAAPFVPPMEGVDHHRVFTLRSIPDMDKIKQVVDNDKPSKAIVVGAGFIGLETAEALVERGIEVSLIEAMHQAFAPFDREMAQPIHTCLNLNGIDLKLGCKLQKIHQDGDTLNAVLEDGQQLKSDMIILAIGVKPETKLAVDAGLEIGERGGILVNKQMQTSAPDIYAVGDAIEVEDYVGGFKTVIPLAGPANKQGRIAAENILGGNCSYSGTQGTSVCKIFNITAGSTGLNEKTLKRIGRNYEKIYIHPSDHAGYYPGASTISLKMLFDPENGLVLGAQAVGTKGVDKRIDVFAAAIRGKMTVHDLSELELSYAPPYGSAKDPVNYAGFVASNIIDGNMPVCHWEDMLNINENQVALDVRTSDEVQTGTIPESLNIPLAQLRNRLSELPKDKELLVFCRVGLTGYIASRILLQNGFKCRNLSGGMTTYKAATAKAESPAAVKTTQKENSSGGDKNMSEITREIDACGLQCPGPVMKLKNAMNEADDGQTIAITSTDPGFVADIPAWCESSGNSLIELKPSGDGYRAVITKGSHQDSPQSPTDRSNSKTMVVFSNDFDKAMAAFIIANGAASTGSDVTLFFTFWGLNLLRKKEHVSVKKNLIEKMFGFMMPRGPEKTTLSKMNMGGMGTIMIKGIMKKKNVSSLPELIENAKANGVRLVACAMSMDLMGIKKEELIDGVETGGVAMYLGKAEKSNVNLFI
ncbi:MAG: FAD-dependent oxidoreductase [Sedimentisphaeraceae bacterium JB056]